MRGMGKDGQLGQRGWIRRRGGRVKRVLHFRVVDLGVLGARVSGARWVTARASYRERMFPIATPHGCTRESSTCRRARDGGGE